MKKRKIILSLIGVLTLTSCNKINDNPSSTQSNGFSTYVEDDNLAITNDMLNSIGSSLAIESVVSAFVNQNGESSYTDFIIDVQSREHELAMQQYDAVSYKSIQSRIDPTRDTLVASYDYARSKSENYNGALASLSLGVNNKVNERLMVTQTSSGYSLISWDAIGFDNPFSLINESYFTQSEDDKYRFDLSLNKLDRDGKDLSSKLAHFLIGNFAIPAPSDFSLFISDDGESITGYEMTIDASSGPIEQILTLKGDFVSTSNDEKLNKYFAAPKEGKEDERFISAFKSLKDGNYTEKTDVYYNLENSYSASTQGNNSHMRYMFKSSTQYEISDKQNIVTSFAEDGSKLNTSYYYYKNNLSTNSLDYLEVRNIPNKGFYQVGNVKDAPLKPNFDISSLVFESDGDGNYYFDNKKGHVLFDMTSYSLSEERLEIDTATISLLQNSISIEAYYTYSSSYATLYYKVVTTFSNIGTTSAFATNLSEIKDNGDDLNMSELLSYSSKLKDMQDYVGGQDNLNQVPVLGGLYNKPDYYFESTGENKGFQIQYLLDRNYLDFDTNNDKELTDEELDFLSAYEDEYLNKYKEKLSKLEGFSVKEIAETETTSKAVQASKIIIQDKIQYTYKIFAFLSLDSTSGDIYFVIELSYDKKLNTVTLNPDNGDKTLTSTAYDGETVSDPKTEYLPIKEGYRFDGWFLEGETTAFDFSTKIYSNLSLTAHYTKMDNVNVTFDLNYEGSENVVQSILYNAKPTEISAPQREGYTFKGWTKQKDNKDTIISNPFAKRVIENTTYYALWEKN